MSTATSTTESVNSEEPDQPSQSNTVDPASPSISGWFSSIVQSAKDSVSKASSGTFESIKRDLNEFKDTVQNDATSMVYSTASMVKNKLNEIGNTVNEIGSLGTNESDPGEELLEKTSQSAVPLQHTDESHTKEEDSILEEPSDETTFKLDTLNTWTNILTDRAKSTISMFKETIVDSIFVNRDFMLDELNEQPYVIKDGQVVAIENWQEMLHDLQTNAQTFCREPSGPPEEFDTWLLKFNLIDYQKQMEYLLENVPEMKKFHQDLVPHELSESDFWHRYYYNVYQLKEQQKHLILHSDDDTTTTPNNEVSETENVNIKYHTDKATSKEGSGKKDNDSKASSGSTEDWEKMEPTTEKSSSDEDRDWVKCD